MTTDSAGKDKAYYLRELTGSTCAVCDRTKRPGYALCWSCYKSLPDIMQKDLYRKIGAGFEEAFEAATAWLR